MSEHKRNQKGGANSERKMLKTQRVGSDSKVRNQWVVGKVALSDPDICANERWSARGCALRGTELRTNVDSVTIQT